MSDYRVDNGEREVVAAARELASAALETLASMSAEGTEPWDAYERLAMDDARWSEAIDPRVRGVRDSLQRFLEETRPQADGDRLL